MNPNPRILCSELGTLKDYANDAVSELPCESIFVRGSRWLISERIV